MARRAVSRAHRLSSSPDGIDRGNCGAASLRCRHHRWWPQRARLRELSRAGRGQNAGPRAPPRARRRGGYRGGVSRLPDVGRLVRHEPAVAAGDRRPRARTLRSHGAAGERSIFAARRWQSHLPARRRREDAGRVRPLLAQGRGGLSGLRCAPEGSDEGRARAPLHNAGRRVEARLARLQGRRAPALAEPQDRAECLSDRRSA